MERGELQPRRDITSPIVKISLLAVISVFLLVFVIISPNDQLRSKGQFKSWYSQFREVFAPIAKDKCAQQYDTYLYGTRQNTTINETRGAGSITLFVEPMIKCVLEGSSEYVKYALGSAQVMLGLTPTIIALLGASSEEVCLLALIGRRRFLALLLAAASPSIYTSRAFEYRSPGEILRDRLGRQHVGFSLENPNRIIIIVFEYVLAVAALANVATVSWQLGVMTISGISPNTIFMPMLWSLLAIPAHIGGVIIFNLRAVRVDHPDEDPPEPRSPLVWLKAFCTGLKKLFRNPKSTLSCWGTLYWNLIRREFWLHPEQGRNKKIHIQWFQESRLFIISAWFLSVMIVFHIILGTIIMSSSIFIGPRDALGVMVRYVISVVTCRVILVYELAVMRVCYKNGLNAEPQEANQEGVLESTLKNRGRANLNIILPTRSLDPN
ncbi:MAG: hypothetical protein M1839_005270 [Geoglossum umbratile]|nr:MAG: hypothetical protein M1839_005270 [Geoglossum umbratile]